MLIDIWVEGKNLGVRRVSEDFVEQFNEIILRTRIDALLLPVELESTSPVGLLNNEKESE